MANFLARTIDRIFPRAGAMDALASPKSGGAGQLPPLAPIKAPKGGGLALPSWRKAVKSTPGQISKKTFDVTNVDLTTTYRNGATTVENVRNFARFSPEMSASHAANNRIGIPEKYYVIARNPDESFNLEGTQLAMQIIRQMNSMADYQDGFSHVGSLRSVCEALAKSMQEEGAMAMELVLDKARLPLSFQPVGPSQIVFEEDNKGLKPVQKVGGDLIDLDSPTFFWTACDPDLYDAYPRSPMEAAMQPVLQSTTFLADMRRLCARNVYQRYDIVIDREKLEKQIPAEIQADQNKLTTYLNGVMDEIQAVITDLGVEEAFVHYDFFTLEFVGGKNGNGNDTADSFETVNKIINSKLATALRTGPSVLGMGTGSASMASTETLMTMLNANGMIRLKLMELLSKAMTLAVRLFGMEVSVEFVFDDIDLRPAGELEAYRSMRQSRLLTALSFGFLTDEEFALMMYFKLPPPGHTPISGTKFAVVPAPAAEVADNGNNTSQTGAMKKTPEAAKGKTK